MHPFFLASGMTDPEGSKHPGEGTGSNLQVQEVTLSIDYHAT